MNKNVFIFILTTILLVAGQALWKISSSQISKSFGIVYIIIKLSTNIMFLMGCVFYIAATGLWIYLLGQYQYSKIYPIFVGVCIIMSLLVGGVLFEEYSNILQKIIGIIFILLGIIIITK